MPDLDVKFLGKRIPVRGFPNATPYFSFPFLFPENIYDLAFTTIAGRLVSQ